MFCHQCGKEILDEAKFCNNCGGKIIQIKQIDKKKESSDEIKYENSPKILFFENDEILTDSYGLGIEKFGFHVVNYPYPPKDKKVLINLVLKERPEIILTGIIFPEMDGYELTKTLKADNRTKNVPVFALTNMDKKEEIEMGIESGMKDYFVIKKFQPRDIVKRIREIFGETIENEIKLEDIPAVKKEDNKKGSVKYATMGLCFGICLIWSFGFGGFIPYIIGAAIGTWFTKKMLSPKKWYLTMIYWIVFVLLFFIGSLVRGQSQHQI
ncbi:MAG: response regulator [Patescibacteria group bacterium]|nr:response regulator [Patescibacteria group bacterium]